MKKCPVCGDSLKLESDFGSKRPGRWYMLTPVRNYCSSCHTEIKTVIPPSAWAVLSLVLLLSLAALVLLNILESKGAITSATFDDGLTVLTILMALGSVAFRSCWRY